MTKVTNNGHFQQSLARERFLGNFPENAIIRHFATDSSLYRGSQEAPIQTKERLSVGNSSV
jgi:hypothetical protein